MASSSTFRQRFGSLVRAYALIGYAPAKDFRYIETNRADARQRRKLERDLRTTLGDVRAAVSDWPRLQEAMRDDALVGTATQAADHERPKPAMRPTTCASSPCRLSTHSAHPSPTRISTLQPATIRPSLTRAAAPTR